KKDNTELTRPYGNIRSGICFGYSSLRSYFLKTQSPPIWRYRVDVYLGVQTPDAQIFLQLRRGLACVAFSVLRYIFYCNSLCIQEYGALLSWQLELSNSVNTDFLI